MNYSQTAEIAIVELEGEIDANTAPKIGETVSPLTQAKRKVVLNFTNVVYMSSSGLRMLLSLHRQALKSGGELTLVGLSPELQDTMSVVGFLDFFQTYETLNSAVASPKRGEAPQARVKGKGQGGKGGI